MQNDFISVSEEVEETEEVEEEEGDGEVENRKNFEFRPNPRNIVGEADFGVSSFFVK